MPERNLEDVARLTLFGRKAGLAFQIVDDVLDLTVDSAHLGKTAGKDMATEKATWPAVYGIEQSQRDAARLIEEAFAALAPLRQPRRRIEGRRPLPGRAEKLSLALSYGCILPSAMLKAGSCGVLVFVARVRNLEPQPAPRIPSLSSCKLKC
jgi:hypothetical protein